MEYVIINNYRKIENALVFLTWFKPCIRKSWIPYVSVSVSLRHVATSHCLSSQCWQWQRTQVTRRYLGHIVDATSVAWCCLDGDSSRMRFVCGRSRAGRGPAVPPERVPDRNTNAVRSTRLSYSSRFRHQRVSVTNYSDCPTSWNQTNRLILEWSRCMFCKNQFYGDEQETLARARYLYRCVGSADMLSCLLADFKGIL